MRSIDVRVEPTVRLVADVAEGELLIAFCFVVKAVPCEHHCAEDALDFAQCTAADAAPLTASSLRVWGGFAELS